MPLIQQMAQSIMHTSLRFCLALLCFFSIQVWASLAIQTISPSAFKGYINSVSFQQDAIATYKGYQYAVYWSAEKHVAVARRAINDNNWQTLELTDYTFEVDNAHYDISLGISPRDGTLHLSFYQWSSIFNYRKSVAGLLDNPENFAWDKRLFGQVQHTLTGADMDATTYPRFVSTPSGKLLFLLRHGESGAGDSFLYEYDGATSQWLELGKLVDGLITNINAYFNGIHFDAKGRLHATWVWRATPDATTNFNLHYIYSDDDGRTWQNNNGQTVAELGRTSITQNTQGIRVWSIDQNRGLINQESQAIDQDGRVSMLMSHLPDAFASNSDFYVNRLNARVFHYLRDLNGQWQRQMLPGSSYSYDRNKIAADGHNNLYAIINRDGIYRATAAKNWQDWALIFPLNDQNLFGEVQIDRQQLAHNNVLSFINITNTGRMQLFEFIDDNQASNATYGGGPTGYLFCAFEGDQCTLPNGLRDVAFGANGQFKHLQASNSIACTRDLFPEPIRGSVKRCYYSEQAIQNTSSRLANEYQLCASEGQTCNVTSLAQIAYGARDSFHYRMSDAPLLCSSNEFGDPINGVVKQCFVAEIAQLRVVSSRAAASSLSSVNSMASSSSGSLATNASSFSSLAPSSSGSAVSSGSSRSAQATILGGSLVVSQLFGFAFLYFFGGYLAAIRLQKIFEGRVKL